MIAFTDDPSVFNEDSPDHGIRADATPRFSGKADGDFHIIFIVHVRIITLLIEK